MGKVSPPELEAIPDEPYNPSEEFKNPYPSLNDINMGTMKFH